MTFLNPLVLLGMVAVGIPLLIHLFNFRKPKRVDFSSLAFLREVQRSTMQRVRIKQWLLLLLRALAIASLVAAFARPLLEGALAGYIGGSGASSVAIVIDDSPSMTLRDAEGAFSDQAQRAAQAIAASTDAQDEVLIVALGRPQGALLPGGPDAARRARGLESSASTRTLASGLAAVLEQPFVHERREIYLIGDLQASTLSDSTYVPPATDDIVFLVPVGTVRPDNVSVSAARVVSRIVEAGQPVAVEATLVNHGDTPAADYTAGVYLEDARVAQVTVDLPPRIPTTVRFVVTPEREGWLDARVQTEDDAFPIDNLRYFALHTPEARRVLLVGGEGAPQGVLAALLSEQLADRGGRFRVTAIPEVDLPATALGAFDVVVLNGPASLSSGEVNRLNEFVRAGGGLFLLPGPRSSAQDLNSLFSALGAGRTSGLTTENQGEVVDVVDRIDGEHPLFGGVLEEGRGSIERPQVQRRLTYSPGRGTERAIMQLASGEPFLQEIRSGRGTVLLLAVALDPAWSDLPSRGLVVPLTFRSLFLLSASEAVEGELFLAGEGGQLLLPGVGEAERLLVEAPDGSSFAPERRRVTGGTLLDLRDRLAEPGHYAVRLGERVVRRFAVNLDPRESNLTAASAEEATSRLQGPSGPQVQVLDLAGGRTAGEAIAAARRGVELWNVFLLVALLLLTAEMLVASRWRPEAGM